MFKYYEIITKKDKMINESKMSVSTDFNDRNAQEQLLNSIFGNNWDKSNNFFDMKLTTIDDYSFLTYKIEKIPGGVITIIKDKSPVVKYKYLINFSKGAETAYEILDKTTYIDGTSKIENRSVVKTLSISDNMKIVEVNLLNKNNGEYSNHEYTLYKKNDDIISFLSHGQMWMKGQESYEARLSVITKNIYDTNIAIDNKLNMILNDEEIKEYKIKRKGR